MTPFRLIVVISCMTVVALAGDDQPTVNESGQIQCSFEVFDFDHCRGEELCRPKYRFEQLPVIEAKSCFPDDCETDGATQSYAQMKVVVRNGQMVELTFSGNGDSGLFTAKIDRPHIAEAVDTEENLSKQVRQLQSDQWLHLVKEKLVLQVQCHGEFELKKVTPSKVKSDRSLLVGSSVTNKKQRRGFLLNDGVLQVIQ